MPTAASQARTLSFDHLHRLDRATRLGSAPSGERMQIGVALQRPHPAAEDALLKALYDPSNPSYHRFPTPGQFAKSFGADMTATRAWLRGGGLHLDYASATGDYLLATGTVAQVERLTRTTIDAFRFSGERFLANVDAPQVPGALPILTISGLNTYERHRTRATPNFGAQSAKDLWSIYEQPSGATGEGVSVAILGNGATDTVINDLHKFDAENGLRQLPVDVVHTPSNGDFTDKSGNGEWDIDMQAIHGMAPGISREVLYFAPTLRDTQLVAATARWVDDPSGPPIMNASLGECEVTPLNDTLNDPSLDPLNGNESANAAPVSQGLSNSSEPAQTQILKQAVIEGRTLFAASGDAGSSCTAVYPGTNGIGNYGVPLTEDPANNPYAVGVGGTVLYGDGNTPAGRFQEYAWTHSGGNPSPFEPAPAYQQGVTNLDRPCVTDPSTLCRGVPDVAAISGDVISNGYAIVSGGQDSEGGGTSLSSPLWAGMWARLASTAPAGSPGYGFANEAIYKVAKDAALYPLAFHDITVGTNGLNPAQTGYDYVTGFGVPRLGGLISAVQKVAPAAPAPATSAAPAETGAPGAPAEQEAAPSAPAQAATPARTVAKKARARKKAHRRAKRHVRHRKHRRAKKHRARRRRRR